MENEVQTFHIAMVLDQTVCLETLLRLVLLLQMRQSGLGCVVLCMFGPFVSMSWHPTSFWHHLACCVELIDMKYEKKIPKAQMTVCHHLG